MHVITEKDHQAQARRLKQLLSVYQRNRDLINVGAYAHGSDPLLDQSIAMYTQLEGFLKQDIDERVGIEQSLGELSALFR